jgi:sec-independent protein translocase protein TatC
MPETFGLDSPHKLNSFDRARAAVSERVELPGMSLIAHLDELRKRFVHSALYLVVGYVVALVFAPELYLLMQAPLKHNQIQLNFTHRGIILASPLILYQVWLFIAPGLYRRERGFLVPFMFSAVGLFCAGAFLSYHFVFPSMLNFIILQLSGELGIHPIISVEEYTSFFFSLILGMGATFELPVVIFFLAMFGIVSPRFLWKNVRYAILIIFIIVAVITPTPDIPTQLAFAVPMLLLYLLSMGVAWWVHPDRRRRKEEVAA